MESENIALMEALKELFSAGLHDLEFTKKDGTPRSMLATRDSVQMPISMYEKWLVPDTNKPRKESTTSLPVFDVEIGAFRSFALDNLISVDGMTPEMIIKWYEDSK